MSKCVVLGVSGGIAAYKSLELASRLVKAGVTVYTVMTENAAKLASPLAFQTLTKNPVAIDTFSPNDPAEVAHIALAAKADLFVVAPATANILAKMAHGIADDMLSTTLLAVRGPVLAAPAMNTAMWEHPATQANLRILRDRGILFIGPEGGKLACGDSGMGRMTEPKDIADRALALLDRKDVLSGKRVLVTAGPTREALDPVRFITNRSSGKMGYAIAEAALEMGAQVTLVTGPVSLVPPAGARVLPVETTEDLLACMLREAPDHDLIIQAAAPADYRPLAVAQHKIKKQDGGTLSLTLTETPDVARAVGEIRTERQLIAGFAAETDRVAENAEKKLREKRLDMIVANDVTQPGAGFDVDTNIITVITKEGSESFPMMSKKEAARTILDRLIGLGHGESSLVR